MHNDIEYSGLNGRDKLIEELKNQYLTKSAATLTYIQASCGQGKSYITNKLIDELPHKLPNSKLKIFWTFADALSPINDYGKIAKASQVSISGGAAGISAGLTLGWQNESSQYEKIRQILGPKGNKNILICVDSIEYLSDELQFLIFQIIKNIPRLEKDYNKSIFMLMTGVRNIYEDIIRKYEGSFKIVKLPKYKARDIKEYFDKEHKFLKFDADKIYSLCNGNLNLADFLYNDLIIQENPYLDTLTDIVQRRLALIKEQGTAKELNDRDMEDIIFAAALAIKKFSVQYLRKIVDKDAVQIKNGLEIACNESLLKEEIEKHYSFISEEIQEYMTELAVNKREDIFIAYYNYYAKNEPDQYFLRAYYIYKYQGYLSQPSRALLLLAYCFAKKIYDEPKTKRIESFLLAESIDPKTKESFLKLQNFFDDIHDEADISVIASDYNTLVNDIDDMALRAEITSEYFEYLYRKTPMDTPEASLILEKCYSYVKNELTLSNLNMEGFEKIDETMLRLKIIYAIAPCYLDQKNDYVRFDNLYKLIESLTAISPKGRSKSIGEYIENVFNRKAFLFVNQAACDPYYEKAMYYFKQNEIWVEYYVTLVCQAGSYIVTQNFQNAIAICQKVEKECEEKDIRLPQIEKLHNNRIIAEFLLIEQTETLAKAIKAAKKAITALKKLLNKQKNATQYVIYTNICSLYLYTDNKKQYINYKQKLEKLYGCTNIADINDENVDDFYRYYFSWFELYCAIRDEDWEKAKMIAEALEDFIPALFRKQEIFWKRKIDSAKALISNKNTMDAYDFCHKLVSTKRQEQSLAKFFYRGLMVSDIQYTSYF